MEKNLFLLTENRRRTEWETDDKHKNNLFLLTENGNKLSVAERKWRENSENKQNAQNKRGLIN